MPDWYVAIKASAYLGIDAREWPTLARYWQERALAGMNAEAEARTLLEEFHRTGTPAQPGA